MMRFAMSCLVVGAFFGAALWSGAAPPQGAKKDAINKDLEKLEGTWTIVSMESKTHKIPEADLKEMQLTIKGNQWAMTHARGLDKASIRIDPTKDPKTIDLIFSSLGAMGSTFKLAPGRKITSRGIYKLEYKEGEGDTLTLCRVDDPRVKRPKEFKTSERAGMVLVFRRRNN